MLMQLGGFATYMHYNISVFVSDSVWFIDSLSVLVV